MILAKTEFTLVGGLHLRCISHSRCRYLLNRLLVIVDSDKKWENLLCHRQDLCSGSLWVYSAPYEQPLLTTNPSTTARSKSRQLFLADLEWSTGALRHNSGIWVDCCLEAPVNGCNMQKLDRVHECRDRVTRHHLGLSLKVCKMKYSLYSLPPAWAICSKKWATLFHGQHFSRSGEKIKFIACKRLRLSTFFIVSRVSERCTQIFKASNDWKNMCNKMIAENVGVNKQNSKKGLKRMGMSALWQTSWREVWKFEVCWAWLLGTLIKPFFSLHRSWFPWYKVWYERPCMPVAFCCVTVM